MEDNGEKLYAIRTGFVKDINFQSRLCCV